MSDILWWIVTIIGPLVLLIVLVWLVMRRGSSRTTERTEQATHDEYVDEEIRRREGTEDL